jgi:O-antigen ligase
LQEDALLDKIGQLSFSRVNQISLGHSGCSTVLAALLLAAGTSSPRIRAIATMCIVTALVLMYWTGSRGPIVSLACGLAVLAWWYRLELMRSTALLVPVIGLAVLSLAKMDLLLDEIGKQLRFSGAGTDMSSIERIEVLDLGIDAFLSHPIFGSAFAIPGLGYPHNVFVEAGMAMGVVGLLLFTVLVVRVLALVPPANRTDGSMMALVFIQFLIGGQFSGSLWSSQGIWIGAALMLGQAAVQRNMRAHRRATFYSDYRHS